MMLRSIGRLATAGAIGQGLALVSAPLLTRLYTPQDFAVYALLSSIAAYMASVSTGRLEMAIPLPIEDERGEALAVAAILASFGLCLLTALAVLLFPESIAAVLGDRSLIPLLWLIPATIFVLSGTLTLPYFFVRNRDYKPLALNTLLQAVATAGVQVGSPLAGIPFSGLLISMIATPLLASMHLFSSGYLQARRFSLKLIRSVLSDYRQYPFYGTAISIVNSAVTPLMAWFLYRHFGAEVAGLYALAQRVVVTPARVLQEAVRKVFWGEATAFIRQGSRRIVGLFLSILTRLLLAASPFVVLTMLYAEPLVALVFGEEWRSAGFIVTVLAPMAAVSLAITSVANFSMIDRQRLGLAWSALQTGLVIVAIIIATSFDLRFDLFIVMFSAAMITAYVLQACFWLYAVTSLYRPASET